jgi:hypothetical protein
MEKLKRKLAEIDDKIDDIPDLTADKLSDYGLKGRNDLLEQLVRGIGLVVFVDG